MVKIEIIIEKDNSYINEGETVFNRSPEYR